MAAAILPNAYYEHLIQNVDYVIQLIDKLNQQQQTLPSLIKPKFQQVIIELEDAIFGITFDPSYDFICMKPNIVDFRAPEVIEGKLHENTKANIYSIGILLSCLFGLKSIWENRTIGIEEPFGRPVSVYLATPEKVLQNPSETILNELFENPNLSLKTADGNLKEFYTKFIELIAKCTRYNPGDRFTDFTQISDALSLLKSVLTKEPTTLTEETSQASAFTDSSSGDERHSSI